MTVALSSEWSNKKWHSSYQMVKEKKCHPCILHLAKLSFKNEGEIKTSSEGKKVICH